MRRPAQARQIMERWAGKALDFEPGTKWQYSPGLTVCGRVVEVASGKPYEKFLAERVFRPLKMNDTTDPIAGWNT